MPDVRMPDGTIIRNVPEGTTREQLQARVQAHRNAQKPTSFGQGFLEGIAPPALNALSVLENLNPVTGALKAVQAAQKLAGAKPLPLASDMSRQNAQIQRDRSATQGSTLGKIAGGVVGTAPTMFLPGGPVAQSVAAGALSNEDGTPLGILRDAATGGVTGKLGQLAGKHVVAPVAERIGRTAPARAAGKAIVAGVNKVLGRNAEQLPLPQFSTTDKAVNRMAPDLAAARQMAADADRLNLPVAMADVDPRLQQLAGSVARHSPDARALAEQELNKRARGQADRAVNAINEHLAPYTNIEARSAEIKKAAQAASKPFYDEARAMDAPVDDQLSAMLRTKDGRDALKTAYGIAENKGIDPANIGFVLDDYGNVSLRGLQASEAGRYASVANPNANTELTRTTVRGINGPVPKVGPIDMVGWLRLNGGLQDQGGELAHMGLNNAARKLDFAGQEQRFGPLVSDKGMNLDDAAHAAWEAGYFPHRSNRPSVNEFLDALRGTHEGWNRHFLPEDGAELARFQDAQAMHHAMQQSRFDTGRGLVNDTSEAAGPRPFAPDEAYREVKTETPTFETLQLAKRGMDAQLNQFRNPITRQMEIDGNPVAEGLNDLRNRFNARLGELNEPYRLGNEAYAKEIARRTALQLGYKELSNNALPQRQFDAGLATLSDRTLPEAQRGLATSMADTVNRQRLSANPYESVYGSTNQQAKVADLFPQGAEDFGRIYDIEGKMAQTRTKALGGSQTQANKVGDDLFQNDAANLAVDGAMQAITGGGIPGATKLAGMVGRKFFGSRDLGVLGAEKKANAIAPLLFDTSNPRAITYYLDELAAKQVQQEVRRGAYRRVGGMFGVPAAALGVSVLP